MIVQSADGMTFIASFGKREMESRCLVTNNGIDHLFRSKDTDENGNVTYTQWECSSLRYSWGGEKYDIPKKSIIWKIRNKIAKYFYNRRTK